MEYHTEFQGIAQDLIPHPNNMLGHLLLSCLTLYPTSELVCPVGCTSLTGVGIRTIIFPNNKRKIHKTFSLSWNM